MQDIVLWLDWGLGILERLLGGMDVGNLLERKLLVVVVPLSVEPVEVALYQEVLL